jgi:F-type H+-transporting ATPase subunit b
MFFISAAQAAEAAAEHHEEAEAFLSPHSAETWVAVAFIIVVALLAKPVFRGITAGLDTRAAKIKARIEEAERLCTEAKDTLATYQKKQRDALKEAEDIVAHAKAEAERLAAKAAADLEELLKRREQQAVDRINQAEGDALREVRNTAVDIAVNATRALISQNLPAAQASALVDKAIEDLPNRLH